MRYNARLANMTEGMSEPVETPTEAAPPPPSEGRSRRGQVVVRYGRMGAIGLFRHDLETPPAPGTMLVIRTERGTELGRTLTNVSDEPGGRFITRAALDSFLRANGAEYEFFRGGRVLRAANPQDLNDQAHLDRSVHEAIAWCRDQIRQFNLNMKIVEMEHLLGGERIVFFFISEERVDFRELVKQLAGEYHTRIEMRQVGARDEARLVADYERCGQHCCCKQYLKLLKPVSMRMAKVQKATLDPSKISGRCGRLMCCLRYEDRTYDELAKTLPRRNVWVRTEGGVVGKVVDAHILTQIVRLMLPNGTFTAVKVEEIAERGVPEPPRPEAPPPRPQRVLPVRPQRRREESETVTLDQLDANLDKMAAGLAGEPPAEAAAVGGDEDFGPAADREDEGIAAEAESEARPDVRERPEAVPAGGPSEGGSRKNRRGRRKRKGGGGQGQGQGGQPQPQRQGGQQRRGHPEALSVPPRMASSQPGQRPANQGRPGQPPGGQPSSKKRHRNRRPRGGGGGGGGPGSGQPGGGGPSGGSGGSSGGGAP